jgi:hypothetical protein
MLATMVYRAAKATRNAPAGFGEFRAHDGARTPVEILSHIGDLCDWGLSIAVGHEKWVGAVPHTWDDEVSRFYSSTRAFDEYLASSSPLMCSVEQILQGPIADAISHVGQIAMLRRFFGNPIRGESYFRADIKAGQVGANQPAPKKEFD